MKFMQKPKTQTRETETRGTKENTRFIRMGITRPGKALEIGSHETENRQSRVWNYND